MSRCSPGGKGVSEEASSGELYGQSPAGMKLCYGGSLLERGLSKGEVGRSQSMPA